MDINKALRTAISTGEVRIGMRETKKALAVDKARLVIVSSNLPDDDVRGLKRSTKAAFYTFRGNNKELGFACGKPFAIGVLAVLKQGDSDILALKDE
jgi:large subunit ribosomal protein L30e